MNRSDERARTEVAEFRYSLIAELTNPYLPHGQRLQLMAEKAAREYQIPYSSKRTVSVATMKKWLRAYRKYGKEGLRPKRRSDAGICRGFTAAETEALRTHLRQHPQLTATAAYRMLLDSKVITSRVGSSTLSRFVRLSGLTREERYRTKDEQSQRKFEFFAPLECVQADCLHAFAVADETGKRKKALLIAFLDDATRRVLYADFSFSEQSLAFEKGIKHILTTHGRIGKLYVDNGSTFVAKQTSRILDSLGIPLIHSRPQKPAGRGKIERFFRTVRDGFLRPLATGEDSLSIRELNSLFKSWVELEYNRAPHRGLSGMSPLEAWLAKSEYLIATDPTVDLDLMFLHHESRKVSKDRTFTLHAVTYEAPSALVNTRVTVLYDPHSQIRSVRLRCDGVDYGTAGPVDPYANSRIRRNSTSPPPQPLGTSESEPDTDPDSEQRCIFSSLSAADIDVLFGKKTQKRSKKK